MKIRINTHGNPLPEKHGEWIDLCTAEDAELKFLEYKEISLGVAMELPKGYYAHVLPRSSTFKNWGVVLVNSVGIIDNAYCGDGDIWRFPAVCLRPEGVKIPKGTRICQFRLVQVAEEAELEAVQVLGNDNRGGIGSTGTESTREKPVSRTERVFGPRESWPVRTEKYTDDGQGPYRGFLMVKCDECGEVKAYCAKKETYSYRCKCGYETPLENLRPMYMYCKCGKSFRYKKNLTDKKFSHACMDCGSVVDMELNSAQTAYVTVGDRR